MKKICTFLAALLMTISAFEMQAQSDIILFVDGTATGNDDGTTWADAYVELADALLHAAGDPDVIEIWVAEGTYYPQYTADGYDADLPSGASPTFPNTSGGRDNAFVLVPDVKIYGGFTAPLTTGSVPEFGTPGRDGITILSGDLAEDDSPGDLTINKLDNCYHVVISAEEVGTALLDGFTITGGNADDSGVTISVNGVNVDGMAAGGMYNINSSPTITNVTISENSANDCGGILNYNSSPIITNVLISGNSANGEGGGMSNLDNSLPVLTNVTISGNSADSGGGMVNSSATAMPSLNNVIISGNSATQNGGGMYNNNSSPTLTNVTINGNSADCGGGIYNYNNSSPILTNVLISGNNADTSGGGIFNSWLSSPTLTNVTISGNNADLSGGGMYNSGSSTPEIMNSILWGNTATNGDNVENSMSTPKFKNSLVEGSSGGWTDFGDDNGNNIDDDPLFVNWIDPSSEPMPNTDGDYSLEIGSPAIDAGDNSLYLDARILTDTSSPEDFDGETDLAGNPRLSGYKIDMGAYETAVSITITTQPAPTTTLVEGFISGGLTVAASATPSGATLSYEWYFNTTDSYLGSTPLGETTPTFTFPTNLTAGNTYYVYCVVSTPGAFDAYSDFAEVEVIAPAAPAISGPTTMTLTAGYATTQTTGVFTITGDPAPTVTKTSGNTAITWNDATKRLNIATGLPAGTYPVVLKAANGVGTDANITFTLTVNAQNQAPTATGPASWTITAGYAATSTSQYTLTGNPAPTVTKLSGNDRIEWNSTTQKFDIATGLAAGTYPVVARVSNGVSPNDTIALTLTVTASDVAPSITGPTAMMLTAGYAAISTSIFTVRGTSPVTVSKTSGNASITWNDATQRLDIATGLSAGSYPVVLRASGLGTFTNLTFTLTVTTTNVAPVIEGPVSMTLVTGYTATTSNAFTLGGTAPVTVTKSSGNVAITWNNDKQYLDIAAGLATGSYPVVLIASNVTAMNDTTSFTLIVTSSNVSAPTINSVLPTGTIGTAYNQSLTASGVTPITWSIISGSLPNGLTMSNVGAITGTPNTTGTFTFTVQATNSAGTHTQAFSLTIRTNVDNEAIASTMLKGWTNDGKLYVSGLTPGESWRVYNILGNLVYHAIADSDEANVALPGRGVYIVACGNQTIKVNN